MWARAAVFLGSVAAVAIVLARCLPDLPVTPPLGCGSGVVDLDDGEACDPGDSGVLGCNAFCQVDCDGGMVDDATSHCYFWTQPTVQSASEGNNACLLVNAHLVSFVDLAELTFVTDNSKSLPFAANGASWVALNRGIVNEAGAQTFDVTFVDPLLPGWAATCPGCFAYTDASDFPLPTSGKAQQCVNWRQTLGGSWVQAACNTATTDSGAPTFTSVLCEREPPGIFSAPCGDAGRTCIEVPVTRGAKRYDLSAAANFANARADCSTRGGSLVRFESAAEREEVTAQVKLITQQDFWIGLSFDGTMNVWTWVDGTHALPTFPTPWADMEPSISAPGYAAAIHFAPLSDTYTTNLARATDATVTLPYVCEFAVK